MSDVLPIIEGSLGAGPPDWASWLLRCPIGIIHREHITIRTILKQRGFAAGVDYLDALLAYSNATRLPDGAFPPTVVMPVHMAAGLMKEVARAADEGLNECIRD
ncbi:hypothetical protein ELH48_13780 [Rhizobium ruizarguesonis]|uniref:hypothetical protein n=1 Tax=Rhizobium ruizarguesonis TaxID=2081791 RepID=UPI001030AD84|nr:hypothetical protein [Rhizobium ruizarguesonis]TBB28149.1 hypothetical protein ELH48_13780 [Rhizobium ruizarguesonis]TBB49766.1 hypothetical protein ELH46_13775 [Rhizobium ruizarguesonis]